MNNRNFDIVYVQEGGKKATKKLKKSPSKKLSSSSPSPAAPTALKAPVRGLRSVECDNNDNYVSVTLFSDMKNKLTVTAEEYSNIKTKLSTLTSELSEKTSQAALAEELASSKYNTLNAQLVAETTRASQAALLASQELNKTQADLSAATLAPPVGKTKKCTLTYNPAYTGEFIEKKGLACRLGPVTDPNDPRQKLNYRELENNLSPSECIKRCKDDESCFGAEVVDINPKTGLAARCFKHNYSNVIGRDNMPGNTCWIKPLPMYYDSTNCQL